MGEFSKIQWTDATWNPWHGCKKVSEGCKYCYMYRDKERYKQDPTSVIKSKSNFLAPINWSARMQASGMPHEMNSKNLFPGMKIFTCSWSDWFIEDADQWREEAWNIIYHTPEFQYQILTKRPERIESWLPKNWGEGYSNVWLGVSIENQERANDRIPILRDLPAKIKFLSVEPLLAPIYLGDLRNYDIDWVIIGGESGNDSGKYKYRPCELNWMQWIVEDCRTSGIPVFVKQLGTHLAKELNLRDRHGGDISEFPNYLKIRQMPYLP